MIGRKYNISNKRCQHTWKRNIWTCPLNLKSDQCGRILIVRCHKSQTGDFSNQMSYWHWKHALVDPVSSVKQEISGGSDLLTELCWMHHHGNPSFQFFPILWNHQYSQPGFPSVLIQQFSENHHLGSPGLKNHQTLLCFPSCLISPPTLITFLITLNVPPRGPAIQDQPTTWPIS